MLIVQKEEIFSSSKSQLLSHIEMKNIIFIILKQNCINHCSIAFYIIYNRIKLKLYDFDIYNTLLIAFQVIS